VWAAKATNQEIMVNDCSFSFGSDLRTRISDNLDVFERRSHPHDGLKRAAVAVVVVDDGTGDGALVLTKRSSRLRAHTSQWALPGGRLDEGETPIDAVLRELSEEVNVSLSPDHVLGTLDDYPTRSGYLITPVVVWADPEIEMIANPDEVASIHRISFRELNRSDSPNFITIPESDRPVIQMLFNDSRVHAPTGAVMYQFREVGLHGRDVRVDQLEQPVWAWK
jgi:8-oxo-dGTP pyrophosphatase MutT (NUDIX family)